MQIKRELAEFLRHSTEEDIEVPHVVVEAVLDKPILLSGDVDDWLKRSGLDFDAKFDLVTLNWTFTRR